VIDPTTNEISVQEISLGQYSIIVTLVALAIAIPVLFSAIIVVICFIRGNTRIMTYRKERIKQEMLSMNMLDGGGNEDPDALYDEAPQWKKLEVIARTSMFYMLEEATTSPPFETLMGCRARAVRRRRSRSPSSGCPSSNTCSSLASPLPSTFTLASR
jgi:hypothetical protein